MRFPLVSLCFIGQVCIALALAVAVPEVPAARAQSAAGSLDTAFSAGPVIGNGIFSISGQSDGKVLVGGASLVSVNGVPTNQCTRLNGDGSLDESFKQPVIESYDTRTDDTVTTLDPTFAALVQVAVPQADGKILIGGNFYFVNGVSGYGGLFRSNADGSVDGTFQAPRFNGTVYTIVPAGNGGYYIGGDFAYVGGLQRNCLVRLKANGKLDASFDAGVFAGTPASGVSRFTAVRALAVQSDGKLVIGGSFSQIDNTARLVVARLNSDGSLDGSYNATANFNTTGSLGNSALQVSTIALQADGKAVIGGLFVNPDTGASKGRNSIFRLNADGTVDTGFNSGGAGTAGMVNDVVMQNDGKILAGGSFTSYNGVGRGAFARLLPDGTLDTGFDSRVGANQDVFSLFLQPDGKLLLGGYFSALEGVPRGGIGRVNTEAGVSPAVTVSVEATVPRATLGSPSTQGVITVRRTGGNLSVPLFVNYAVSGTAMRNVNYRALQGIATIAGGSTQGKIKIKPLASSIPLRKRTVVLTVNASAAYGISNGTATVKIITKPTR